jgi:predicted ATPase
VSRKEEGELQSALDRLIEAGLLSRQGVPPFATYLFKHALVQDAAYSTLLRGQRQQIHARIATALESQFPQIVAADAQLMARHCAEAGLNEKAVGYWLTAGQQAVVRSAMTEAVSQLQKGLDLLAKLPEGSQHQRQELDLQIGLARALTGTKGYAAPAAAEAYGRARSLADQLDLAPSYLAPLLYGLWAFHRVRGELNQALALAKEMEQLGKARDNLSALLLGKHEHGLICYDRGELTAARALLEQCEGLRSRRIARSSPHGSCKTGTS